MTDKDKQTKLPLGDVEYITDPSFVPPRKVDQIGIENLTVTHLYELLEEVYQNGNICIDIGDEDGDTLIVVDGWEDRAELIGILNGFEGLGEQPFLFGDDTYASEIEKCQQELKTTDPKHLGTVQRLEKRIEASKSWIEFENYLSSLDVEAVDFEDFGVTQVFGDEYSRCACGNCSNIVRTSPDSYSWTPPLFLNCEGYVSDECVADGSFDDDILENYVNEQRSLPTVRSPEDLGLVQINEDSYQHGWYGGQLDSPAPIIEALNEANIDVWFKVYPRQFDLDFDVYVREGDKDKATNVLKGTDTELDYDPAVTLAEGLKNIPPIGCNTGVTINTIDASTGKVKTKVVSKQDFIDGKALDD